MINEKNTAVIVDRVGNGYTLRPLLSIHEASSAREVMVFQDKGFVSSARDYQKVDDTLFGWLDAHFSEIQK